MTTSRLPNIPEKKTIEIQSLSMMNMLTNPSSATKWRQEQTAAERNPLSPSSPPFIRIRCKIFAVKTVVGVLRSGVLSLSQGGCFAVCRCSPSFHCVQWLVFLGFYRRTRPPAELSTISIEQAKDRMALVEAVPTVTVLFLQGLC